MEAAGADPKMHLKEWLVAQIDSERYDGLRWEVGDNRRLFRIPWKHAAKKDYRLHDDAALFKAWAVYKGKHKQGGPDRDNPTMWKTRLRCALNKSTDFQEVPHLNQLDISEPYKVYRIEATPRNNSQHADSRVVVVRTKYSRLSLAQRLGQWERCGEDRNGASRREHAYCGPEEEEVSPYDDLPLESGVLAPSLAISDFRMDLTLFYRGEPVTRMTTSSPDGCFVLQGCVPVGNEKIYGPCSAQQLSLPTVAAAASLGSGGGGVTLEPAVAEALGQLLAHLERGVLLWVAPDGLFVKRFCQGRVYWSGPLAPNADRPNKLERDRTCKLLDAAIFVNELQNYVQRKGPEPRYEIDLCFGEEYPDPNVPKTQKLITVHVVPLFAAELLQRLHLDRADVPAKAAPLATATKEEEEEEQQEEEEKEKKEEA